MINPTGSVDPAAGVPELRVLTGFGPAAAVRMAEDHVLGLDPDARYCLAHRVEAGAPDRSGGEVRADRPEPEPVGDPDRPRDRHGADEPAADVCRAGFAPSEHLPDPDRGRRRAAALGRSRLGESEKEGVDGRL